MHTYPYAPTSAHACICTHMNKGAGVYIPEKGLVNTCTFNPVISYSEEMHTVTCALTVQMKGLAHGTTGTYSLDIF